MTDYSKSVVYKIHKDDICYIGSTNDEKRREQGHKDAYNNENSNLKVYKFIRENGGWDNWIFEVIQRFPCDNKKQLVEREYYYYDLLKPLLNSRRPRRTKEELKEQKAINGVKHYKANKDEISKKNAERKDERAKYNSEHYEKNKEKINQNHVCECGGHYTTTGSKNIHLKLNKHIAFLKTINNT